jgi:putative selenium metabolism hydrolase
MQAIRDAALASDEEAVAFFREIIQIPSFSGREENVVKAIRHRMETLGYDEVRIDDFGNVLGRIGHGPRTIAFDAHVDTVEVGDSRLWKVDPFAAEVQDGVIYGRGASDQKGGMAALVYAGALIKKLDLAHEWTVWIVGSVLEEDCDGLCWHYILSQEVLAPDLVVLTEPTDLQVYRGHRGRMEIEVTTRGVSCHGSAPERGVNAIYRMAPVIRGIEALHGDLRDDPDPFLGAGSVTISEVRSTAPSLCAVSDSCTIHLDRRVTAGETDEMALAEIGAILEREGLGDAEISVPEFERPSHTGMVFPMRQYYPAWALPENHRYVQAALGARNQIIGEPGRPGRWVFSTNGVATMGLHGVPTLGFGPANEVHAHAPTDQCPVDHIGKAVAFYATLVALLEEDASGGKAQGGWG